MKFGIAFEKKIITSLDLQQIHGKDEQFKYLMRGFSPLEYEWINTANLLYIKSLIKVLEARILSDAKTTTEAKGT